MSGPNAALSLPPEDRTPAAEPAPPRDQLASGAFLGTALESAAILRTLESANVAADELRQAQFKNDVAGFVAAADKLAQVLAVDLKALSRHFARAVDRAVAGGRT